MNTNAGLVPVPTGDYPLKPRIPHRIRVDVLPISLPGDEVDEITSVEVTCTRCHHAVEIYGNGPDSITRGCATLRETCPNQEKNFYMNEVEFVRSFWNGRWSY